MATEVIHTIRASGGDYPSLIAWEADQRRNLVAANEIAVAECYDDWPSGLSQGRLEIRGDGNWTMDPARYVEIRVAPGNEHNGDRNSGFLIRTTDTTFGMVRWVRASGRLVGVRGVQDAAGTPGMAHFLDDAGQEVVNDRVLFDGFTNQATIEGPFNNNDARVYSRNCLFLDGVRTTNWTQVRPVINFENCGASGYSQFAYQRTVIINCWAHNSATDFLSPETGSDYCAAEDGTAPGSNSIQSYTAADEFVDPTSDWHLKETSTFRGAGTNLYSDPDFTKDIDLDDWPAAGAWDIGPDYYVSAAPVIPTLGNIQETNVTTNSVTPQIDVTFP